MGSHLRGALRAIVRSFERFGAMRSINLGNEPKGRALHPCLGPHGGVHEERHSINCHFFLRVRNSDACRSWLRK